MKASLRGAQKQLLTTQKQTIETKRNYQFYIEIQEKSNLEVGGWKFLEYSSIRKIINIATLSVNPEAKAFLNTYLLHRSINKKYFALIPEHKFDFRMVDTDEKKSDSPIESLAHHINVENTYLLDIDTGSLKFGASYDKSLVTKSKDELLKLRMLWVSSKEIRLAHLTKPCYTTPCD